MTKPEVEILDEEPKGVFDLENITGEEFLQQMYYMCEARASKDGSPVGELGTVIAFQDMMEDKQLYMLMFPFPEHFDEG